MLSHPFHHLKNCFNLEQICKKIKIRSYSHLPTLYHSSIINNDEKIFLRYYNAMKNLIQKMEVIIFLDNH